VAAVDPRDDPSSVVAAQRVLLELWTILAGFADAMTIVGGARPSFHRTPLACGLDVASWPLWKHATRISAYGAYVQASPVV
jgi:hypothetical protein